jgi:protocatechuate 4,5-dioxygenase, beta chain
VARILAGIGTSHVPAIGVAVDLKKTGEPYWKPVFEGYEATRAWLAKEKPDVAIVVYNDHACAFSLDIIPTFAIGCAEEFPPADEGWGARPVPVVKGHPELAHHITRSAVLDEFDLTIVNKMAVDHGLTVPLSLAFGEPREWPCRVIPIAVNFTMYPFPTGNRCYRLGKAIRRAVDSFDQDLRVVIFGTGGMSHQIHGRRAGLINREFDRKFLDALRDDPQSLAATPHAHYMREAGAESVELIMWLIMRGALDDEVEERYRFYHVAASNTAVGHIVLENRSSAPNR